MMRRHQTLIFHRVVQSPDPMDPYTPNAAWFERMIVQLKSSYRIMPLLQAIALARDGSLPRNSLSITFDDGYADNFDTALPILEKHGVPATFFVTTGYLDGGLMWNDAIIETTRRLPKGEYRVDDYPEIIYIASDNDRKAVITALIKAWKHLPPPERQARVDRFSQCCDELPRDLMMSSDQVRKMNASDQAEIGGHTDTHPILLKQSTDEARKDIETGRRRLEEITGIAPRVFAYPNGKYGQDFGDEHTDMVREAGFLGAVTTDLGYMTANTDKYRIPRFSPWSRNLPRFRLDLVRAKYGLL